MHKKPLIAVLALGLLLFSVVTASATFVDGSRIPVQTWGGGQSKTGTPALGSSVSGPTVTVNAGSNRTVPGTFCDGQYQGPLTYGISAWYAGNEFYAGYQDPTDPTRFGTVCSNSPSFDVTAVNTIIGNTAGPFPFTLFLQPLVLDVVSPSGTAGCTQEPAPVAGGASCTGPLYSVTWNAAGFFALNLPFPVECCQTGAYYATWYGANAGPVRIGTDGGSDAAVPPHLVDGQNFCSQWNEYGAGWLDMDQFWEANFGPGFDLTNLTWSEGYSPDDPASHCNAGNCSVERVYDDPDVPADTLYGYFMPSNSATTGRDRIGVRVSANGLDTIRAVEFYMDDDDGVNVPDLVIEIYDPSAGPLAPCSGSRKPNYADLPVYSQIVPGGSLILDAFNTVTLTTPYVWGTLNGGPTQDRIVAVGNTVGPPAVAGQQVLLASVPTTYLNCSNARGIMRFQAGVNDWKYFGEPFAFMATRFNHAAAIGLDICREVLPAIEGPCAAAADENWSSFAHDAQHTSASSIDLADPNGVTLAWSAMLPQINSFNQPSVHDDVVYVSSDNRLGAYDLATGAVIGSVAAPQIIGANRGNTTIAFMAAAAPPRDYVFMTGGNGNSVHAYEEGLLANIWTRTGATGLGQQCRFNASAVVNIAGTDVLFVCTEPGAGGGRIWAIDAVTGGLYAGWATNPVLLDVGSKHSPAVSGGKLYLGTAIGISNLSGSLYQINAADGVIDWTFQPTPGEGWPSGVSVEGDFLYGQTTMAGEIGHRYKIDKSGALPAIVWSSVQGDNLYGTPTIGRGFVYFPLDAPNTGILQVDKSLGLVVRNFNSADLCGHAIGNVTQIATLSCDAYLFAGDRSGRWWLFNTVAGTAEWYHDFPQNGGSIVNGTALASHSSGDDYAVMSCRASNAVGNQGSVSAYRLNAGPRPRLIQCVYDVTIEVPFGTGAGNPHSEADALLNVGNAPLTFTGASVSDPAPTATIARDQRLAASARQRIVSRFQTEDGYFAEGSEKYVRLLGRASSDAEFMDYEVDAMAKFEATSTRPDARSMAASASMIRTSNITVGGAALPTAVPGGSSNSLDWDYDGTGLGRGTDVNVIELASDDPDFEFDGSPAVAEVVVTYIGGCGPTNTYITWNRDGNDNFAKVFNHGAFGDQDAEALHVGDDPNATTDQLFDGGVLITGDSSGAVGGAELAVDYYNFNEYLANPNPVTGNCAFSKDSGLVLGYVRTGGCPGVPEAVTGMYVKTYYADSNQHVSDIDPLAAIGVNVEQTEVGADNPLYGDFKLTRLVLVNRDAVAKTVRAGTYFDWDIRGAATSNVALVANAFNGYAIWDDNAPMFAYGMLDANQPSSYGGVDPTAFPPALIMSNLNDTTYNGGGGNTPPSTGDWIGDTYPDDWGYGWMLANGHYAGPRHAMGGNGVAGLSGDRGGFLLNELNLASSGSGEVVQSMFFFPVTTNTDAAISASSAAIAKKSARWAGFARGDVNDDGMVDLADVCWLTSGNQLYPDAYSGDVNNSGAVDAADEAQLLSFVSGNAAARPIGAWRFPW